MDTDAAPEGPSLVYDRQGPTVVLTMNRPARRNALSLDMIVRLADSLGWDVPTWERLTARAPAMLEGGYSLGAVGKR